MRSARPAWLAISSSTASRARSSSAESSTFSARHQAQDSETIALLPTRPATRPPRALAPNIFASRVSCKTASNRPSARDLALHQRLPFATMEQRTAHHSRRHRRDHPVPARPPPKESCSSSASARYLAVTTARLVHHELNGENHPFLPFNKGHDDGAATLRTERHSNRLPGSSLARDSLANLIESYLQLVKERCDNGGRPPGDLPALHQLGSCGAAPDAETHGAGERYLIQHSPAPEEQQHRLVPSAHRAKRDGKPVFDRSDRHRPAPSTPVTHLRQMSSRLDYEARGDVDERRADPQGAAHRVTRAEVPFISRSIGDSKREPPSASSLTSPPPPGAARRAAQRHPRAGAGIERTRRSSSGSLLLQMHGRKMLDKSYLPSPQRKNRRWRCSASEYVKGDAPRNPRFHTTR